jgi:hypothetical protein
MICPPRRYEEPVQHRIAIGSCVIIHFGRVHKPDSSVAYEPDNYDGSIHIPRNDSDTNVYSYSTPIAPRE